MTAGGCTGAGGGVDALGNERGAALFVVLLLTALLFSLGVFGTRSGQIELMIAGNDLLAKRALETADAGINHAVSLIRERGVGGANEAADGFDDELGNGGSGGALDALGSSAIIGGEKYRFAAFGDRAGDGYFVRAIDNFDEAIGIDDPTKDRDRRIVLVSRGRIGPAERVIHAVVERDPTFPCVLCGNLAFLVAPLDVALIGALSTDSYDSRVAPYDPGTAGAGGNIFSNGDISMASDPLGLLPVNINGNVVAAREIVQVGAVNVTGNTTPFAPPIEFPSVQPCGPPFPPNQGITGGSYDQLTGLLVNAGANDVIELAPGEYCFSSILMAGLSSLRVNGAVRIHLTAPSVILGVVNTTNVAGNLRIFSSLVSPVPLPIVPGLAIAGGAQAAMAVYAPDSIVTFAGLADFYGAVVGGMIPNAGIARLHYDAALANPDVRQVSWREARNVPPD